MKKNSQTVRVWDEQGTVIGYTYPKRAKGLVKKCRAEFVSDKEIRLNKQCPTYENMEDNEMDNENIVENKMNFITVNPREWCRNPCSGNQTVFDRFMISNPLFQEVQSAPSMVEVLSVGQWAWHGASYVINGFQELEPRTEYHFVFWLNGGENDRSDETCQLQILFSDNNITASTDEFMDGLCFRLNRGYIKPLKKHKGWELYDIPFTTTDARYTQCQFVADRAPMALMSAERLDAYKNLPDVLDPYEAKRPQRHNIIFEDGWPAGQWYSTERLAASKGNSSMYSPAAGEMQESMQDIAEELRNEIIDGIDIDALRDDIMADFGGSKFSEEIIESIRASFHPNI